MFKVEMPKLIDLAREIEAQETLFASIETVNEVDIEEGQAPRWKLSDGDLKTLKARIERMAEFAERSHLGTSHALLVKRKDSPPKTAGEWQVLVDAIQAELEDKLFLFVPPHRARFFALSMKDSSVAAFPIACREIQHAGFCLSAGMFTASIFHAMRAGEIGVRALSEALDVQFNVPADQVEWRKHQNQIAGKITQIENGAKSAQRAADLEFYGQNAAQLQYFNDGWRVRAAHARATYDEGQAISVLNHTIELIDGLASRVKEPA